MCWNDAYLILGMGDQYLGNCHNNTTQIYSLAMYVGMADMKKFFAMAMSDSVAYI